MKVYGPYTRDDGRKHVIIMENGFQKTVSYPKYLMEQKLGRKLTDDETVDHRDGDFTNDDPSNLRVRTRAQNASLGVKRLRTQTFSCPTCGKTIVKAGKALAWALDRAKKGKAGPFCNRSCAGKYGKEIQLGLREKQLSSITEYSYYKQQTLIPISEDKD